MQQRQKQRTEVRARRAQVRGLFTLVPRQGLITRYGTFCGVLGCEDVDQEKGEFQSVQDQEI